jgi:Family of unknown function (DUF5709)
MSDLDDERSEQLDQDELQPGDDLENSGLDDFLDQGYSPPEKPSHVTRYGDEHETLDERLAEEEPEVWDQPEAGEYVNDGQVGDRRAGRLVDPNAGIGPDTEKDMVGEDVGIDGAGASAEEAAVHIVPDDEPSY